MPAKKKVEALDSASALPALATGPVPGHTTRLLIVRSPGGFLVFSGDLPDHSQLDADPAEAIAVAATAPDLSAKVVAWANAKPAPEYPA